MDRSFKFWDRMAKRYSNQPLADEAAYLEKLREMKSHIDQRSNVLELGCGTGSTALFLAPYAQHYHAIDYSSRMLALAQEKADRAQMHGLSFERLSVDEVEASESAYDVVIGMSVLHLLTNWREVIARVYVMLKPGGVFYSNTACLSDMETPAKHLASLSGFMGLLPRLSVFTEQEYIAALEDAGLKIFHKVKPGDDATIFVGAVKMPG